MTACIRLRALRVDQRSPGLVRAFSSSIARHNYATSSFTPARRLSGRRCMITGGTSGIGFAIAARFLQEGAATVTLVGRSKERLLEAAKRLGSSNDTVPETSEDNGEVATRAPEEDKQEDSGVDSNSTLQVSDQIRLLVGDVSEAGSWMRELESEMGNIDILVNAAGISTSSILPRTELSDISRILRTNLEGAILTSRAFLRASIRSRVRDNRNDSTETKKPASKCIINVSSLLALKSGSGAVPYAASKAGLLGLTRSVAVETSASLKDLAFRSNAIVPGYIDTPMLVDFTPGEVSRLKDLIPLHRFGDPSEVADAAVFLAQNEYANNCVLNLDGGLSAV
ncbi:hypothetical protein N7474_007688 [Penicillium riverlandense]|uniref:uncharacterized protein n=1 Tax=Penicillium riverlandense TaxID=1903569 RepID=UPI002547C7BF|nr:uncharacterized protein N7474_007688 [Penicillium riverlandense]KAJ5811387.1 hypothetical protein N7474_007688 [Penicillium riverlandense]